MVWKVTAGHFVRVKELMTRRDGGQDGHIAGQSVGKDGSLEKSELREFGVRSERRILRRKTQTNHEKERREGKRVGERRGSEGREQLPACEWDEEPSATKTATTASFRCPL